MTNTAISSIRSALESGRVSINALDDGSGVLLDIEGEQLLSLNRTGMYLVQTIERGTVTVDGLGEALAERYEVDLERAVADVEHFVAEVADSLDD